MIAASVVRDFVQESGAERAVERLRNSVAVHCTVLRSGIAAEVPVERVIAGDVALLSAGDLVPADSIVLESRDLFVNQATLTGESYPVEKQTHEPPPDADLTQARGGSSWGPPWLSGSARVLVVVTGRHTELAKTRARSRSSAQWPLRASSRPARWPALRLTESCSAPAVAVGGIEFTIDPVVDCPPLFLFDEVHFPEEPHRLGPLIAVVLLLANPDERGDQLQRLVP